MTDDNAPPAFDAFPPLVTDTWIAIPDEAGLLILDAASGRALLDWKDPNPQGGPSYLARTAQYRVEGLACNGETPDGRPLALCGDTLLSFSGRTAVLVDVRNWTVTATGRYRGKTEDDDHITARIDLGRWALVLDGRAFRFD